MATVSLHKLVLICPKDISYLCLRWSYFPVLPVFWCYCSGFLWSRKCVCMLWVCSGLTGALEKPAVSGGCWTAVLTWLLVYLQQCWGQGFINLRVKRRRLFSPLTALHLSCWPANAPRKCNPHRLQGQLGLAERGAFEVLYWPASSKVAWCLMCCFVSHYKLSTIACHLLSNYVRAMVPV